MNKQQKIRFPVYKGGHIECPLLYSEEGDNYISSITSTGLCELRVIGRQDKKSYIDLDANIMEYIEDDGLDYIEYYNYNIEFNGRLDFNDYTFWHDKLIISNKSDRHIFIEIDYDVDDGEIVSYKKNSIKDAKGFEFYEEDTIPRREVKEVIIDRNFKLVKFPKCKILNIDIRFDPLLKGEWEFSIKENTEEPHTIYEEKLKTRNAHKEVNYDTEGLISISNRSVCYNSNKVIPMFIYFNIEFKDGYWFQYPY